MDNEIIDVKVLIFPTTETYWIPTDEATTDFIRAVVSRWWKIHPEYKDLKLSMCLATTKILKKSMPLCTNQGLNADLLWMPKGKV